MKDYELSIIKSQLEVIASKLRNASVSDSALVASSIEHVARVIVINPKTRTKTEFVECDNLQSALDGFESMSGFEFYSDDKGCEGRINSVRNLALAYGNSSLYRKVETEIDERNEFIDTAAELLNQNSHDNEANHYKEWFGAMFDSGKFKLVE